MQIQGLQKLTLLDYPGKVACTLFSGGCNFRCPFCQNGNLVQHPEWEPVIPEEEIFAVLEKRRGVLDGVCVTGGEPTLDPDLERFVTKIKELGYLVKLDTNGYRPEILKKLVNNKYIALNKKTQIITPTLLGENIFDVVSVSIRSLLNPELTASWEKGLTYVAEGQITQDEYMGKLENFVTRHTVNVKQLRNQFQLKSSFDASAPYYRKASSTRSRTGKRTAAEDSSAKSYSTARKKGAQNS